MLAKNNLKSISFFQGVFKQVKFSNNNVYDCNASLGILTYWAYNLDKSKSQVIKFLSIYPFFSNIRFINTLTFKVLAILYIKLFLFYKNLNLINYSSNSVLIKPKYNFSYFFYNLEFNFFSYNSNILAWSDLNKQLFKSNFLNLTFKTTKRNIFLIVSSASGSVLWKKSSGIVGFSGKHKKAPEALRKLVDSLLSFLRDCNVTTSFIFRFFFVKSLDKNKLDSLLNLLTRLEIYHTYIIYDIRQPHGYMRLRKQRRL